MTTSLSGHTQGSLELHSKTSQGPGVVAHTFNPTYLLHSEVLPLRFLRQVCVHVLCGQSLHSRVLSRTQWAHCPSGIITIRTIILRFLLLDKSYILGNYLCLGYPIV